MADSGFRVGSADCFGLPWPKQDPPQGETRTGSDQNLRALKFSPAYNNKVPDIVLGITSLALSTKEEMKFETDADNITGQGFDLSMDSWGDTVVHEAGVTWLEIDPDDPELQSGGLDFDLPPRGSSNPAWRREAVVFPYKFRKTPLILLWATGFDTNYPATNFVGFDLVAQGVSQTGFSIDCSFAGEGDSNVPRTDAVFCNWLAISPDKKNATCGSINPFSDWDTQKTGRTTFPAGKFDKAPKVCIALRETNQSAASFRNNVWGFKIRVTDVTKDDFGWSFEGVDLSIIRYGKFDWVAFC